jgi:lipopolysaccharide export system protein LptC
MPTRRPTAAEGARAAAERHTKRVKLFKWLLPTLVVGVVVVIGGMIAIVSFLPGIQVSSALITSEGLTMVEPRLSGHANGRAYDVTASKAFQNLENPKLVRFVDVDGRIEMKAPNWAKLLARSGTYDANTERIKLEKGVTVETTDGYKLKLDHATIDLAGGALATDGPVAITGPNLTIDAVGAEVMESGSVVILKSAVRVTLVPKAAADTSGLAATPGPVASQGGVPTDGVAATPVPGLR